MQNPSPQVRTIVTVVLIVGALLSIIATPLITKSTLPAIIDKQISRFEKLSVSDNPEEVKKSKLIEDTPYLVSFFFPMWMALSVFGGIVALAIAKPFWDGKLWARGLALLAMSMPSMAGAYMLIPWINFVGFEAGFPPAIIISLFGLVPYFTILLAEKGNALHKAAHFITYLLLGVAGAHSFTNGHASFRFQWMHPARPLWPEGTWVLWLSTQVMWLGTLCLIIAIYFLGVRKVQGWYLGLIGGLTIMIANYWTHFVRGTTSDYLLGGTLGLLIVVCLLVPAFKKQLYDEPQAVAA